MSNIKFLSYYSPILQDFYTIIQTKYLWWIQQKCLQNILLLNVNPLKVILIFQHIIKYKFKQIYLSVI